MMAKIPLRKHWVATDAWRGYYEYDNSIAGGCILWGNEEHNREEMERIKKVKEILKKNKISSRTAKARTSNVFSGVYDIVVSPSNLKKAKKLVRKVI
jgi:hypothetical protein